MQNQEIIFEKIEALTRGVLNNLRSKGMVVPVENEDGTITIGRYSIIKTQGFYQIVNHVNEVLVGNINLPHTALMIANDLALNKFVDSRTIELDRNYGYALFEEQLYKKISKKYKSYGDYDIAVTKCQVARAKKEHNKRAILAHFDKLRKIL